MCIFFKFREIGSKVTGDQTAAGDIFFLFSAW
jgi:hypothetical protein